MDKFKIDLFEKEYQINFPKFRSLTNEECESLISRITQRFNFHKISLEVELMACQTTLKEITSDFSIFSFLNELQITYSPKVFINWFKFERIDELNIADLNKYFDDIWFPSSDDIDLFNDTLDWIITISHYGSVSLVRI